MDTQQMFQELDRLYAQGKLDEAEEKMMGWMKEGLDSGNKSLCLMMARGALISMGVILFVLPTLLILFSKLIEKTSFNWMNNRPPKGRKAPEEPAALAEQTKEETVV